MEMFQAERAVTDRDLAESNLFQAAGAVSFYLTAGKDDQYGWIDAQERLKNAALEYASAVILDSRLEV